MVGRVGGYPPDKKLKTRSPPETQIRKIIISVIRPYMTHGRAAGRTGWVVLSGGLVFTGFCPPLGTGSRIRIWKDAWLPGSTSNRVVSPPRVFDENATVDSLIN